MLRGRGTSLLVGLVAALSAGAVAHASTAGGRVGARCPAASCAAAATARTASPLLVRSTSATLDGFARVRGAGASVYFQYGSGAVLAKRTRVTHMAAAHGRTLVRVRVVGLAPSTRYRFRIVVHSGRGTSYGAQVSFSTAPAQGAPTQSADGAGSQRAGGSSPSGSGPESAAPEPVAPQATEPESPAPEPEGREVLWGAEIGPQFTGTPAPWDMSAASDFQRTVGKAPSILAFNIPFEGCSPSCNYYAFPVQQFEAIRSYGSIPMLNWASMSSPLAVEEPSFRLAKVTHGAFDEYIRSFALAAKAWGHPFFLRFDWEMNGNWFPWAQGANGNNAADFVAAWRHVHDIFTSVGATNVTWVWCPNVDPYHEFGNLAALYPGNAYVDWTCLDGYNFGTRAGSKKVGGMPTGGGGWSTFNQIFSSTYSQIVNTIAPEKPLMIGEVASNEQGGSKAAWITDMFSQITSVYTGVDAMVWFDWAKDGEWPIETSPASIAAFTQGIAAPTFTTNSFGELGGGVVQPPG